MDQIVGNNNILSRWTFIERWSKNGKVYILNV